MSLHIEGVVGLLLTTYARCGWNFNIDVKNVQIKIKETLKNVQNVTKIKKNVCKRSKNVTCS